MSQEIQKSQERTPAEIASELEKKAMTLDAEGKQAEATRKRELAKKVREVESSTVTGTTELKLEALQAKLPALEKADLKEARTISTAEVAVGTAGLTVAAVAINKQIDSSGLGKLGIKDSIKEWLAEELTEELDKDAGFFDKIMHKIKMFFLTPFAKIFGVDLTKKKGEKGVEKEDGKKKEDEKKKNNNVENEKGIIKGAAYNHMADHLFMRKNHKVFKGWWSAAGSGIVDGTWKKDERKAEEELSRKAKDILHSDFVRGKTFNELKSYKDHPEKMDIANIKNPIEIQAASLALNTLLDSENESWMDENLKKYPKWRDDILFGSVYELYNGIGFERIERLRDGLKGVNWQSPGDIKGRMESMMIQRRGDGTYGGLVGENLESLRSEGLDNEAIIRALDTDGNTLVKDFRGNTLKNNPYKNPDAQRFMTDLVKDGGFSKNILSVLEQFGFGEYIKDFDSGNAFTMRQILMLYAITKGGTNLETMNKGIRAELYMVVFGIILEKNPVAMPGKKLIEFVNSPTNKYVAEISEFIGMQVDRATYEGMLVTMGLGADSLRLMNEIQKENPAIFYGVLTAITLAFVAAYYLRVPMVTATIAWGIITAGATMAGVSIVGAVKS